MDLSGDNNVWVAIAVNKESFRHSTPTLLSISRDTMKKKVWDCVNVLDVVVYFRKEISQAQNDDYIQQWGNCIQRYVGTRTCLK